MARALSVCIVALSMSSGVTLAQDQDDYVQMSGKAYAALTCAVVAQYSSDFAARDRLFSLGYELGSEYLAAEREGKVLPWNQYKAPGIFDYQEGMSIDFNIGITWAMIEAKVSSEAPKNAFSPSEMQSAWQGELDRRNCGFLE